MSGITSLNVIPQTIYINYVLEYLDLKDVGCLIVTSRYLKEIFDDNNLWNILYMRTNPLKILDTSIHIGYHSTSERMLPKRELLKKYYKKKPRYWHNFTYTHKCPGTGKIDLSNCCNQSFQSRVPSMEELYPRLRGATVRTLTTYPNNILQGFYHAKYIIDQPTQYREHYYNVIKEIHTKYNRDNGLNMCNLCSNPNHYIRETLGYTDGIQKSDSFKKLTLRKIKTIRKKKLAPLKKKLDKNTEKLLRIKKELEEQEKIVKEQRHNYGKEYRFCSNVESMK